MSERLNQKQRLLNIIYGKSVDFLPSQIDFTTQAEKKFTTYLNLGTKDQLFEYVNNHIKYAYPLNSHLAWLDERSKVEAERGGFIKIDKINNVVYDDWGVGWKTDTEGIRVIYHPLRKKSNLKRSFFFRPLPAIIAHPDSEMSIILHVCPFFEINGLEAPSAVECTTGKNRPLRLVSIRTLFRFCTRLSLFECWRYTSGYSW